MAGSCAKAVETPTTKEPLIVVLHEPIPNSSRGSPVVIDLTLVDGGSLLAAPLGWTRSPVHLLAEPLEGRVLGPVHPGDEEDADFGGPGESILCDLQIHDMGICREPGHVEPEPFQDPQLPRLEQEVMVLQQPGDLSLGC